MEQQYPLGLLLTEDEEEGLEEERGELGAEDGREEADNPMEATEEDGPGGQSRQFPPPPPHSGEPQIPMACAAP